MIATVKNDFYPLDHNIFLVQTQAGLVQAAEAYYHGDADYKVTDLNLPSVMVVFPIVACFYKVDHQGRQVASWTYIPLQEYIETRMRELRKIAHCVPDAMHQIKESFKDV